ncbi:MAG TPA: hypothetical protein VMT30_09505 [Candidatus Saccharimonadia bacterium]|nr:hypothetical protein [Candidatus Saccharimonadia bacterium]
MSQSKLDDLYNRLTSRKLLLCLFMLALAIAGYWGGHITWSEFQTAALGAVGIYTVAEGASDAVGAWRSQPTVPTVDEIAKAVLRERAAQMRQRFPDAVDEPDEPRLLEASRG